MGFRTRVFGFFLGMALATAPAIGHPGAGIVIDRQGQIFFIDTGAGVWKIDRHGQLTRHQGEAFHWMAIDHRGGLAARDMPRDAGGELPVVGPAPTLILSSDFPIAVGPDGALYYPQAVDGGVRVMRVLPGGKPRVFAALPPMLEVDADGKAKPVPWIHGLAAAPDGSLYPTILTCHWDVRPGLERHGIAARFASGKVSIVCVGSPREGGRQVKPLGPAGPSRKPQRVFLETSPRERVGR
jgi:hypothetical protein